MFDNGLVICVSVCAHTCTFMCIQTWMHMHAYLNKDVHLWMCMCVSLYAPIPNDVQEKHVYLHCSNWKWSNRFFSDICMYTWVCLSVCGWWVCLYIFVCMSLLCLYVYVCTCRPMHHLPAWITNCDASGSDIFTTDFFFKY